MAHSSLEQLKRAASPLIASLLAMLCLGYEHALSFGAFADNAN